MSALSVYISTKPPHTIHSWAPPLLISHCSKLTWHSDSDSDDAGAPNEGAPKPGQNRMNRVVVLKGMFVPADLEKEPELLLELKEDVREEAETLGTVTSVTLYDVSFASPSVMSLDIDTRSRKRKTA